MQQPLTCVEICAGAGGQALGLAMAGFVHVALVEYEEDHCKVLKQNRPEWNVICADVHDFDGRPYHGVDLLAGGVPCPPFSVAGKQLGQEDERDLFPEAIRLIKEIQPRAVMLENVRGFLDSGFDEYRDHIFTSIQKLGYVTHIKLLNASDYGVPQSAAFVRAYCARRPEELLQVLAPMERLKREQLRPILTQWQALLVSALTSRSGLPPLRPECAQIAEARPVSDITQAIEAIRLALRDLEGNVSPGAICGALTVKLR